MTIDENKILMEALEEVKERDQIIECNTIDRVLEIIDKYGEQLVHNIVDWSYPEIKAADVLASVREDVLALKGGEL